MQGHGLDSTNSTKQVLGQGYDRRTCLVVLPSFMSLCPRCCIPAAPCAPKPGRCSHGGRLRRRRAPWGDRASKQLLQRARPRCARPGRLAGLRPSERPPWPATCECGTTTSQAQRPAHRSAEHQDSGGQLNLVRQAAAFMLSTLNKSWPTQVEKGLS